MSILSSTNSGRHSKLTLQYLLEHGWNSNKILGHYTYRSKEELLHMSINGSFAYYLKIRYVNKEITYILKVESIYDLDRVIKYFDVLKEKEKQEFEERFKTIDFARTLGLSKHDVQERYKTGLQQLEEWSVKTIDKAQEELTNHMVILDTKEKDIDNPEKYSRII